MNGAIGEVVEEDDPDAIGNSWIRSNNVGGYDWANSLSGDGVYELRDDLSTIEAYQIPA